MIRSKTKYILVALMASISATAQVNEEQSSKWTLTPQVEIGRASCRERVCQYV